MPVDQQRPEAQGQSQRGEKIKHSQALPEPARPGEWASGGQQLDRPEKPQEHQPPSKKEEGPPVPWLRTSRRMIGRQPPTGFPCPPHRDKRNPDAEAQFEQEPEKSHAMDSLQMSFQKQDPRRRERKTGVSMMPIVLNRE